MASFATSQQAQDYLERTVPFTEIWQEAAYRHDTAEDAIQAAVTELDSRVEKNLSGTGQEVINEVKQNFEEAARLKINYYFDEDSTVV